MAIFKLIVNGNRHEVDVDPDTPLLWVLRDTLDLAGTKYGCGIASCGACTVHLNGTAIRSCSLAVSVVENKKIITIEGLGKKPGEALKAAWREHDVPQCGYCQAGQIMTAAALLKENRRPSDDDIHAALEGNLCRCGTYNRIKAAIKTAANNL